MFKKKKNSEEIVGRGKNTSRKNQEIVTGSD